jgi:hypothetical protein
MINQVDLIVNQVREIDYNIIYKGNYNSKPRKIK